MATPEQVKMVERCIKIENKIIHRCLRELIYTHGFGCTVEYIHNSRSITKLFNLIRDLDEAELIIKKGNERGWILFVMGNDGYDVIADYTTNIEKYMAPIMKYAETFKEM